ncbi:MAG: DUF2314 domain-containing protein [Selenomonadaceae bacterium]|nr:DUF2314 domain-containing protein [Selenomonadaceae bacterium]
MKVEEIFFREMYRQICLLIGDETVAAVNLRSVFDFVPEEKIDGFVTYGYIDGETFTFEILAGAQCRGDKVKIFPASYKKSVKLKRSVVDTTEIKIVTAQYSLAFRDRIQMINDRIAEDTAREQTRFIKTLDGFRHPHYPDDVVVYFFVNESEPELLWVRCVSVNENILTGKLLNEPRNDFGCHEGDTVKFGVAEINGQNILIYLPSTEGK